MMDNRFTDIIQLIKQSRTNAIKAVNAELITLYWNIGEYICRKIEQAEWGDSIVTELAKFIQATEPEIKGFSDKNLWRMKQFYETYKDFPKLSTLLREISWSHNLAIFSRCKTAEEREFYLKLSKHECYSFRELDRQISSSLFERTMIGNSKLAPAVRESGNSGLYRPSQNTNSYIQLARLYSNFLISILYFSCKNRIILLIYNYLYSIRGYYLLFNYIPLNGI